MGAAGRILLYRMLAAWYNRKKQWMPQTHGSAICSARMRNVKIIFRKVDSKMLDFFIAIGMYDRVMRSDKIKNKFAGYFWRMAIIYAALFGACLALLTLVSGGSVWRNITVAMIWGYVLFGLIVCVGFPLVSFWLVSRKSKNAGSAKANK